MDDGLYLGRWRITFDADKGNRMARYFWGVTIMEVPGRRRDWWNYDLHCYSAIDVEGYHLGTHRRMRTFKAFKRHLRRHCGHLPVGSKLCLFSKYVGHHVTAERVK